MIRCLSPPPAFDGLRLHRVPALPRQTRKEKTAKTARTRRAKAVSMDGLGVLRTGSVKKITQQRYQEHYQMFVAFARARRLPVASEDELDAAAAQMLDKMFLDGCGHAAANYTFASLAFYHPALRGSARGKLAHTRQALRGFRMLAPPASRLPWPWEVVAMLANMLIVKEARGPALVLLTCFELYLRPGECLKLRAVDVVPPISRRKAYRH